MGYECEYCANLTASLLVDLAEKEFKGHEFPRIAFYQHHRSFDELERSGETGCGFCQLVLECFKGTPTDYDPPGPLWPSEWTGPDCDVEDSMYAIAKQLPVSDVKICINSDHVYVGEPLEKVSVFDAIMVQVGPMSEYDENGEDRISGLPPLFLRLSAPPERITNVGKYRIGRFQVDSNLGSYTNYTIAKQWLKACRASHLCCLSGIVTELPTRVIDVGTFQEPRLVHSRGVKAEYIALSHCWGGKISPLLTTETLDEFQNEVPYTSLPANFQDAITITRHLDIQYLWIDSLCIIQDSKRDWEQESKKMGLVYRNSTVTISAISSRGSTHGILKEGFNTVPNPRLRVMRVKEVDENPVEVTVERLDDDEENMRRLQMRGPLEQRGWTLQESMLSPRHLYYGDRQIYWRCPKGYESADGTPPGNKTPDITYDHLSPVLYSGILRHPRSGKYNVRALLLDYYRLVNEYSRRRLTYDSDKLPAFSGLAQRLHPELGGHYLAGLWSSDINCGLLWYDEMGNCKHVQPYRAPSWSWAVTNEMVITPSNLTPKRPLDLQLVDHEIIPRDRENPYGEIVSGHLIVEAFTMPLVRSKQIVESYPPDDAIGDVHFDEVKKDSKVNSRSGRASLAAVTADEGDYILSIMTGPNTFGRHTGWEIDFNFYYPEQYTALMVHVSESGVQGLVLKNATIQSDRAYERAGYFSISEEPGVGFLSTYIQKSMRQRLKLV